MSVVHDEPTMELIKTRLSHSERPLIRLMRTFYKLTMIPTGLEDQERTAEELEIVHMSFLLELRQLVKTLKEFKGTRAVELNRSESIQLEIERSKLEDQAFQEKLKIQNLESLLEQARRDRKNKIQYEEIGKEVRRFSDRFQSADRINGLAREIESLLDEQGFYAERWASRRVQFDAVILNMEALQESIKEEKADADRKKALNDDESDDGNIAAEEPAEGSGGTKVGGGEEGQTGDRPDGETQPPIDPSAQGGSQLQAKGSTTSLNPQAASFLPPSSEGQRTADTPEDRMKIDGEPENLSQTASQPARASSELTPKPDHQPMEIDGFDLQTNLSHSLEGSNEDGLLIEEATMEDGEEIEEAEEGQEIEAQA
ncbi:hypothetical protein MJO29_009162 [Puccinia striiformis f. sp. tritici]|uniref:Uncharacterized protein n=2 Tax=Puccinia striiformis TaxID=27350 RepID=A0A0L0USA4_9BASI|nr:hypothetical protein Pst134EA_017961 [Puccinia striiformis f. sp. tritici]KAI9616033.1 hypothetical protein H4Q26_011285 [Puccinia striiformis f. sp. tritici PST-130]KNE89796.1 hypothetical protein PSTG_16755 [Puccinia striiformis f. sp. tritici PST-78]POW07054.1 hypothetical protein PSTT_08560 [Puccinia striiformis]KAH9451394.1 hypothetical protein Pst134EB_018865 [Puccinia striiformis f. sp. tritici]KAH9461671.1 hypothetical protein Pst134EA_017961 [Puccinia striiformis f. sp. tritici]